MRILSSEANQLRYFVVVTTLFWMLGCSLMVSAQWQLSIRHPSTGFSATLAASFDSWFASFAGLMHSSVSANGVESFHTKPLVTNPPTCLQKVIFHAFRPLQMARSQQWVVRFQRDPTLNRLPICFARISSVKLPFRLDITPGEGAVVTRQTPPPVQKSVHFMHTRNRAFVHLDEMHVGLHHSYSVFVHELAHFAGFVDEYYVRENGIPSHSQCLLTRAPNLKVMEREPSGVNRPLPDGWHGSEQCQQHPHLMFLKPEHGITFMTYFDSPFIPLSYVKLWHEALAEQ